jgi:hypothetical protein
MSIFEMITYFCVGGGVISAVIFSVVVSIGGYFDLLSLFRDLRHEEADETDDGRV